MNNKKVDCWSAHCYALADGKKHTWAPAISTKKQNRVKTQKTKKYKNIKNVKNTKNAKNAK